MIAVGLIAVSFCLLAGFVWWRFYFFHRNPPRHPPEGNDLLCPADGCVLYRDRVDALEQSENAYHKRVRDALEVGGAWSVTATYLSIFDVHVVRSPLAGRIRLRPIECIETNHPMGASFFFSALKRPLPLGMRTYCEKNEILAVDIQGDLRVLLILMADWWINQIVPFVKDGDWVERGQPIGKILMGSQVDVWAPAASLKSALGVGARVRAGETIFGYQEMQ